MEILLLFTGLFLTIIGFILFAIGYRECEILGYLVLMASGVVIGVSINYILG